MRRLCAAALVLLATAAGAREESGDVFLTLENDDLRGKRSAGELLLVQPVASWLDLEAGGRYAEFDEASWGFGIVGASVVLPASLGFASARYEAGAGQAAGGHYEHQIARAGWTRALWRQRVFADLGFELIRVGDTRDDLGKVGLTLVPNDWLELRGGYLHSVFNGRDTWGFTTRTTVHLRSATVFAGYARARDTVDLRSVGRGRVLGDTTHEIAAGVTLPWGPHGVTLAARRLEGAGDTRHTLGLTFRWSLSAPPWRGGTATDRVALHAPR